MFDSEDAQREISVVVGTAFTEVGRVGATAVLGFGREVSWLLKSRPARVSGSEYALHIQCPFRIVQEARTILGSEDLRRVRMNGPVEEVAYDRGAEAVEGVLRRRRGDFSCGSAIITYFRTALRVARRSPEGVSYATPAVP